MILRNFKSEKRAQKQAVRTERRQYLIGYPIKY